MTTIYAITLNWNHAQDTIACLHSLAAQTYPHLKLIAVDNGSEDDSVAQIQAACPLAQLVLNQDNLGFAGGMNRGMEYALAQGADYIFLLNNDTYLAPDALEQLMAHAGPDIGMLAPIIYYADDPRRVWSLGGQVHPWTVETIHTVRGQLDQGQWPTVMPVDFVPGCAMLLPRAVCQQVGLFDEGFFMYYEDFDLCLRIRRANYRILSITTAQMWHKVSLSSGGSDSPNERYWMAHSSIRFFRKYGRGFRRPLILFWRSASALRTSLRLRRRPDSLRAYWRGLRHGLQAAPPLPRS